jgi:uncharacterized protein (DUF697 family)
VNQPVFLHIVERLEGFLGKLPESIQRPVLSELTPLKELFLKQRAPRLVLTGSHKLPVHEVAASLFAFDTPADLRDVLMEVFRWQNITVAGNGTVTVLDARGADEAALRKIEEELKREPADMFLHIVDGTSGRPVLSRDIDALATLATMNGAPDAAAKIIGISFVAPRSAAPDASGRAPAAERRDAASKLQTALSEKAGVREHLLQVLELPIRPLDSGGDNVSPAAARLMSLLSRELPNETRVEMIRVSRDRAAQAEIAQVLVKSTSAISAAIGAQPIPLADLPILTTLQLVMVSGIMHIAGRERSLRAATEFAAALGVNVGAGMILREGTRAVLKFFPGWGNVVCGMVAGAGTYALGRAATVYFLEGVSLSDARRIYSRSRKKSARPKLLGQRSSKREESASGR